MNDVTRRFLSLISQFIERKIVKDSKDFANTIGVSVSSITEISKGRSNIGLSAIQKTVLKFPEVNLDWLISGIGENFETKCVQNVVVSNDHVNDHKNDHKRNVHKTSSFASSEIAPTIIYERDPRDAEIIELQKKHIALMEHQVTLMAEQINDLKKELEELSGFVAMEALRPAASVATARTDNPKGGDSARLNRP